MPSPTSSSTSPILITGATGSTGRATIDALLQLGRPVRAMVHSLDARSEALAARGVEIVVGDLLDFDAVFAALEGVVAAYFVYPIQEPGILEATAYFAQAALEREVGAIVNMSQITARRGTRSHASRNHWMAERLLDRGSVPVTHVRPTLFSEWITYLARAIREQNVLPLPFGDGRYAPISADDQGRVIAAILGDPAPHAGKAYPLFGPVELSQRDIAELLSQSLGRKITYVPMEIEAFSELLGGMGFNAHFQQHMSHVAEDVRNGICAGINDNVETLTGRKPMTMLDYITQHRALFL